MPGWLWPYWAERQFGPMASPPDPRDRAAFPDNVTRRNWTAVGNLGAGRAAIVDPRGLVTPTPGGWSLDWWIGAADRWHLPSREAAVTQSLCDGMPVVETVMRIPQGDAVARVYAVPGTAASGIPPAAHGLVVLEVENRSDVPVAVAFALRPWNPEGLATVKRLTAEGCTVSADGRHAVYLPRPPAAVSTSTSSDGDVVHPVISGRPGGWPFPPVLDRAGIAQVAFVYPLPHTKSIRVALPMAIATRPRGGGRRRSVGAAMQPDPGRLPGAAAVARGWRARLRRGLRAELPDARLSAAVDANRAYLLLLHDAGVITSGPATGDHFRFGEAAYLLSALGQYGFSAEAAEVLASYPGRQRIDGRFADGAEAGDTNGAAIWAIAEHARLSGDGCSAHLLDTVALGARWIARHPGKNDDFWALRGLTDAAWLLAQAGDSRRAAAATAAANRRGAIGGSGDNADVFEPAFVDQGESVQPGDGIDPLSAVRIAAGELEAGDVRAWRRLRWLLDAATPTYTWPQAIHPESGGGAAGDGHDGRVAAGFLSLVRNLLVREVRGDHPALALCTLYPPEWAGFPVEVHDAPTHHGKISYALRWHGDRPALLWECERSGVRLSAPGLDRGWSSGELGGEALLAPYRGRVPLPLHGSDGRPGAPG